MSVKKSVTGLIFVLAAVFAGIFLLRTAHAENETLSLSAETTTLPGGEEVLAVTAAFNGRSVGAVSGVLAYESACTQFLSAEGFGEEGFQFVSEDDGQAVKFVWGDAAEAAGGSRLMVFYFSAAEGASFFFKKGSLTACRAEGNRVVYFELKPGNTIPENLVGKTAAEEVFYDEAAGCVTVNLQEADPAEGYRVYRRPSGGEWEMIGETSELTFRDESPLFGQIAEYTAAAFRLDAAGNVLESERGEPGRTADLNLLRFYEIEAEDCVYTGEAVVPAFRVVHAEDGRVLDEAYFTAEFAGNVNAGTAEITVTGRGEYSGTLTGTFAIGPKALEDSMVGEIEAQTFSGTALTPPAAVTDGARTLVSGTDYTVSYGENIGPGTGTVTVTGRGNYTGSVERTFVIEKGPAGSIRIPETEIMMVYGDAAPLPWVSLTPEPSSGEIEIRWSSSDEAVLEVSDGVLRGKRPGKAVLTAAVPEWEASADADVRVLFSDVADPEIWYFDPVYWALDNEVTSGYGEGTFKPTAGLNRAQTVAFLYKMAGSPDVSGLSGVSFADVRESDWFYDAVRWAAYYGITSGYGDGTFKPGAGCTRAMIAAFLMNYARLRGTYAEPAEESGFPDVPSDAWYKGAVDWAAESGVTSGYGDGTFRPGATCSRAMMVTFLMRA